MDKAPRGCTAQYPHPENLIRNHGYNYKFHYNYEDKDRAFYM
jgi:hypothetical protein